MPESPPLPPTTTPPEDPLAARFAHYREQAKKPRLIGITTLDYYDPGSGLATHAESRYSRVIESDDRPYGPRTVKVKSGFHKIDFGWFDSAEEISEVLIVNSSQDAQDTVLKLLTDANGLSCPFASVGYLRSARFEPCGDLNHYALYCGADEGAYTITVFPR